MLLVLALSFLAFDVFASAVHCSPLTRHDRVLAAEDSDLDVDTVGITLLGTLLVLAVPDRDDDSAGVTFDATGIDADDFLQRRPVADVDVDAASIDLDTTGIDVEDPRCDFLSSDFYVDTGGITLDTGGIDVALLLRAVEEDRSAPAREPFEVDSGGHGGDAAGIIAAGEVHAAEREGFAPDTGGITHPLPSLEDPMRLTQADIRPLSSALYTWRTENSLTQDEMADELGISRKTYVFFESCRWFPPHKERAHFVRRLRDLDVSLAQAFVGVLGTTIADHAVVLSPEEAELKGEIDETDARNAVDAAVYSTADHFDMTAKALREIVASVLGKLAESGVPMQQAARIANAKR